VYIIDHALPVCDRTDYALRIASDYGFFDVVRSSAWQRAIALAQHTRA
jgi:hypothetical protein